VIKYSTEFQQIVTLIEWDNEAFTLQYYWELKDTIKDEIVRMNRSENLQKMIDAFINIDSQQWEWWMKYTEYQSHWVWTASQENWYQDDSMNLDMINRHKSILYRFENAFKRKNKAFWKKNTSQSTENQKCYNCEVIGHLVRNCKKSHCERKELVTMNKRIVHDQLSWTACYNDMCWTHQSGKNESEWYSQKSHEKHEDYDITKWSESKSEVKELAILEKEEIKKTDTCRTQIKDYNNSIWIVLNLNVNQEDVDSWEVNMKLKNQYEHSENQCRVLCEHLLKEQVKELKEKVQVFQKEQWKAEEKMMCEKFDRLMKNTRTVICDTSATDHLTIEHKIVICLSVRYIIKNEEQWLENESYLFSDFLQWVRVAESILQKKYNQYQLNLHSEQHVSAESDEYIKLILSEESQWFKNLWKRADDAAESKNCKFF